MYAPAMLIAAAALAAVAASPPPASRTPSPAETARCRDTIEQVREHAGRPRLERGLARPGKARAWLAVDHRMYPLTLGGLENATR